MPENLNERKSTRRTGYKRRRSVAHIDGIDPSLPFQGVGQNRSEGQQADFG
jgi:hypothetical protein